jgi:AbrB family transcriptional regulator, transcriptional pleiotropic regulator of transition state genes
MVQKGKKKSMKSTGIVRKVDELGRIVVPIELRRMLSVKEKDPLEIFVNEDQIILQKYSSKLTCVITGEISENNKTYGNGSVVLSSEGAKILLNEIQSTLSED